MREDKPYVNGLGYLTETHSPGGNTLYKCDNCGNHFFQKNKIVTYKVSIL
jgi:hypothetical protein